jgi:SET domain-containing protein
VFYAIKDIQAGEEILDKYWGTAEYKKFEWVYALFEKYEPSRIQTMELVQ